MIKKIVLISSIVLLTLLFIYCTTDESTIIGPFGNAGKYITVASFSADKTLLYSNGDTTLISIKVLDVDKTPAIGLIVNFSAQFGNITKSDTTDSSGVAIATFVSDDNTGENIITVDTGIKTYTLPITIVNYQPTTIELSAESLVLLADGNDYTKIAAIPRDEDGNIMTDIVVQLNTSLGTLSSNPGDKTEVTSLTANSGSTGQEAIVYLRSDANGGTAEVTATSGVASSINVYFHLDVPAYIILTADPKVVMADGSSTSIITATVLDETGTEMEDMTVSFSTTSGTLNFPVRTTDENGIAEVELTSSTAEETATVTASAYISSSVDVKFTMDVPYQIVISASPTRVIADGSTVSIITAIPKDKDGNPMAGIDVSFSTDIGALNKFYDETDTDGTAEVELTSNEEGTATVTASVSSTEATTNVTFYEYNPTSIEMDREESSILADGFSQIQIIARALNPSNEPIPGAVIDFSTNYGTLDKTTGVVANQSGDATVTLTSEGSSYDLDVRVKVVVQGTSLADSIAVTFRGIYIDTNIDSARMSDSGIYKAYVSARLFEDTNGENITSGAVFFSSLVGTMDDQLVRIDEQGNAASVFEAEVLPTNQNNIIITSELSSSSAVFSESEAFDIPGVEILINTIDDDVMGDGEGWALVKATLRETTGNKVITGVGIDWATTLGTIIGRSKTNTSGHTIDTLRIENSVSINTNVTITANYGENISISDILTFILPFNNNRLILGFEPDITGHGIIPCDIVSTDSLLGFKEAGISAQFVNSGGSLVYPEQEINFSLSPNNLAGICPTDTTDVYSRASVMLLYPPQNSGQVVRVWAEAPDGTRGSIDVILPKDEEEEDSGGG